MRRRARSIIVLSALGLASGCASIVGFEELDFRATAAKDSGLDGSSSSDAPADGGAQADGFVGDAARDRATPIGCEAGTHDFCEDFEQPILFGDAGWAQELQTYPGSLSRTNGELVVEMFDDDAGTAGFHGLKLERPYEKKASGDRKDVAMKWRLFIEACPPFATHLRVEMAPGSTRFYIDVALGELDGVCWARISELHFPLDGGYVSRNQLRIPASAGEWHDFAFDLAQAQDGVVTTSLRVDDGAPSTLVFDTESDKDAFGAFFGFTPGFRQAGRVRIDDIRIDYAK